MTPSYEQLLAALREGAVLYSAAHLLGWDQETMMPSSAAPARAEGLALLSRLAHQRLTAPKIEDLLGECETDPALLADGAVAANLREIRRDYDRAVKLPPDLVAEINRVGSQAVEAWKAARESKDFALFRPWLERQIELNRRKADCYGAGSADERYDALLEDFEPGMTADRIDKLFGPLRSELTPLIAEIIATGRRPGGALQEIAVPQPMQHELNRRVIERVGLDPHSSRMDVSVHPFSTGIAPGDVRITTRYRSDSFTESLGSTLHEAGHALYEQGLPKNEHWGEPLGEALGLGFHESQSRLWENHVGRSRPFWAWLLPEARELFGEYLGSLETDDLYRAVNTVRPNLIRVESDEATYNLHIMLRFDLERAMLRGDLPVADLPGAWNERFARDLSLEVPDDSLGCMQDIHWAMGSVAYFPTYALGNLYAAQLWEAIRAATGDLDAEIAGGRFESLLGWLRENLHIHGRRYTADETCLRLTGHPLDHGALMRHLRGKYSKIYDL